MSEKINHKSHEVHSNHESHKEHNEKLKAHVEQRAKNAKHEHEDNIEKIRTNVEKEAHSKHEKSHKKHEKELQESEQQILVNKEIKGIAYKRTLRKTQSKLPPVSRAFSKVIHNPMVDKTSEVAGKTVARPSGILFGGIFSFIGSSLFLWAARHYGYEYNFLLFVIFFAGGFFVGLIIELLIFSIRRKVK